MKIVLDDVSSGYNLSAINDNFEKIEQELQDKVLYRDNPVGEPNSMQNALDMNANRIINLPEPTTPTEPLRLQDLEAIQLATDPAIATHVAAVDPHTQYQTKADLANDSDPTKGAALVGRSIGQISTYAAVRGLTDSGIATQVYVGGRLSLFDGAHGVFQLDPTDTTTPDDDGTVLVDSVGRRWKRQIDGDINVRWWLDGTGPSNDCGPGFQNCINAYPRSRILVPLDEDGYYFDTQVVEPNSASYELVGTEGIQSSLQQVMYARTNGAIFYCPPGRTTFTKYRGIRFVSNKVAYPNARAIRIDGNWVHGSLESIVVQNFSLNPLLFAGAINACEFRRVMTMFCDSWGLRVEQGSTNLFDHIIGDNNDGPILYAFGGNNTFRALYSEDCCKRNVTTADANPEFEFGGDAPVINGITINSFAGNSIPPIRLSACRNMTIVSGAQKSTTPPSYAYEVDVRSTDSSVTIIGSAPFRTGNSDQNKVIIEAGYTSTRPSVKVGPASRDIYKHSAVAFVCFDGTGTPTIRQGGGIDTISRVGVGTYDINFFEPIPYANGIVVTGCADNNGDALNVTVSEVLGARTTDNVRVRVQRTDGMNIDVQFVSVVIYGVTG